MKLEARFSRKGEVYSGSFLSYDGDEQLYSIDFCDLSFRGIIVDLHRLLVELPEDTVLVFQRMDRPGLAKVTLEEETTRLIREDPVAAARAMSPAPVVVNLKDQQAAMGKPMKKLLRVGRDTLAAAFGDVIYCTMRRGGLVECPICGRWGRCSVDSTTQNGYFHCANCSAAIPGKSYPQEDGGWWGIDMRVLLRETTSDSLYLPRDWNTTGPWIGRSDLQEKYDEYLKEKERCLENLETR
jgi:hypothetical protein